MLRFLFLFVFVQNVIAQGVERKGTPFVQNYSKSMYSGGNQNWCLASDSNGFMYSANNDGLLVFDGAGWNKYQLKGKMPFRSVSIAKDGRIYTGGFAEFGYWEDKGFEKLEYHSLSDSLAPNLKTKDEIWKIYTNPNRVIFQSFSAIYIYEQGKVHAISASEPFLFLFEVGKRLFVELIPSGLHEVINGVLQPVSGASTLGNSGILSMLPYDMATILIGTAKDGLFLMSQSGTIAPFKTELNYALKKDQLNNGVQLLNKYYAFGTILNGIYIMDKSGSFVQHISKNTGLQNNTVLSLFMDKQQNLWAGLDNGIDRIEINSPVYYYANKTTNFGTVYAIAVHDKKLYIGTNQGLFYIPWYGKEVFKSFDFQLVEGTQGQVWSLEVMDDQLICGHNSGTYLVKGNQAKKISDITGAWTTQKFQENPNFLIQGTYTGLALLEKKEGDWEFQHKVGGFGEPAQYIAQTKDSKIWASGYKGLYLISLSRDGTDAERVQTFGEGYGLPNSSYINVFNLFDKTVFTTEQGFYLYDEITNQFFPYKELNKELGPFASSHRIIKASNDSYWMINDLNIALVSFQGDGKIKIDSSFGSYLNGKMMQYNESIYPVGESQYIIGMDDGFAIYTDNKFEKSAIIPKPVVRRVEDITDSIKMYDLWSRKDILSINYKRNNVRFVFSFPYYGVEAVKFQYFLKGYSKSWSEWSTLNQKDFTNLGSGGYTFLLRAMTRDGLISDSVEFKFEVLPPWYFSPIAWVIYFIGLIGISNGIRKWYLIKVKKQRWLVRKKMEEQRQKILREEALQHEQRLVKLKNEQLKKELSGKKRELANSAMNIVYKNEVLTKVHDELSKLKDDQGNPLSKNQLKKINAVIDDARNETKDWDLFEKSFDQAHNNFFIRLKSKYPELIPNDLKLCAYLYMNMSSKEIAFILNISLRGVEIRRYRLRKKLQLEHDKNLTEFLLEFK